MIILRKSNIIDDNTTLLILKIDIFEDGLLIPIIEYEVYNSNTKKLLNLNICQGIKININIPVNIDENNLFIYNSSNEYYNDICYSYTKNNADIILEDRRDEYINNNLSVCEKDCEYNNYDFNTKKVQCECFTKIKIGSLSEIIINKDKLLNNFIDINNILNINVLKCFKEVFNIGKLILNLGFIIMGIIILITSILSVLFKIKGYYNLKNRVYEIIRNKIEKNIINKRINTKVKNNIKNIVNEIIPNRKERSNSYKRINIRIKNNPNKKTKNRKINLAIESEEKTKKSGKTSKIDLIQKHLKTHIIDNNKKQKLNKMNYNDYELNNLSYKKALKIDKRTYSQYYLSLLRMKHILIFSFYTYTDYNSKYIKIILFLFSFSLSFTITALFFNDTTLHKIYEDQGEYNFIYQIPNILYSTIISSLINIIIKYFSLTEKNILEIKKEKNIIKGKKFKIFKYLTIKFIIFFILNFLFLLFFWFYLTCFCGIYKNSQIHLISDTLSSIGLSFLYPFLLNLLPGILRIPSIKSGNKECLFKLSLIVQLI